MKKIRLGNDIRLQLKLKLNNVSEYANVQSYQVIFVNTTLKHQIERQYMKKNRFIGRFPIEPFVDEFEPTSFNINCSGIPHTRIFAVNEYSGFGWKPDWKRSMPIRQLPEVEYQSKVVRTVDPSIISVQFPAYAQKHPGVYEIIVMANIYQDGFTGNIRSITTNIKEAFELVSDSEQATDDPVQVDINEGPDIIPLPDDIYVSEGAFNDNKVELTRNDGESISIDVSPMLNWYEGE